MHSNIIRIGEFCNNKLMITGKDEINQQKILKTKCQKHIKLNIPLKGKSIKLMILLDSTF